MTTAEAAPDLAAAAAAAPVVGLPEHKSSWVFRPRDLAALMRSQPGSVAYPDSDPRAGWRLCGYSDDAATPDRRNRSRAKLSSDAMRIRTKLDGGDPNRGVLAPFRVTPDAQGRFGIFQANVSSDPAAERDHPLELHCRYLEPDQADLVRDQLDAVHRAGVKRVAHRATRRDETPAARAVRIAAAAERRRTVRAASTTTDGN